jgi:hypothetical protein
MYGLVTEGEPFQVFARREGGGSENLVLKFECRDGMGVLGIRKVGRTDPPPSVVYEESDIEAGSLRAGRFVHVLGSGQRQSYALSRISPEFAARLPSDRWVDLKPHTEYGFRYLVAPEEQLEGVRASVQVAAVQVAAVQVAAGQVAAGQVAAGPAVAQVSAAQVAQAPAIAVAPPPVSPPPGLATTPGAAPGRSAIATSPAASSALPPPQTPMAPPVAAAALASMSRDAAVDHLRAEMAKVNALQLRVTELEDHLRKSRSREKDLLDVLARWQQH